MEVEARAGAASGRPAVGGRRRLRFPGAVRTAAPAVALLVALVVLWELTVRTLAVPSYLLPAPSRVWAAFLHTRGALPAHIRTTLAEAVIGLAVAAVAGAALAAVIASVGLVRRVLYPVLVLTQNIPLVVLAPLLVVWFGFGILPKVIVVALIGFFPIVVSTVDGLRGADREIVDLVRSMGGSRLQVLTTVRIPSAIPAFFAGLKVGAAYAVIGAVIGEWVGASSGLGLYITRSQASFRTDQVFVAIAVVSTLSIALFGAVQALAWLAMPWTHAQTTPANHENEDS
ncbi:MAG: ABC transporter permease [Chloroflexi bacterium]|nr:ABC transporter permease [Chloroflexota bacterium]